MNNDLKYHNYKIKKTKGKIIVVLSIIIIILEVLALLEIIDFIWGLILFFIVLYLKKDTLNKKNKQKL